MVNLCTQWVLLLFARQSRVQETACCEDKRVKSLIEIICMICSFLVYSAGLQKSKLQKQMVQGSKSLKTTVLFFHNQVTKEGNTDDQQLMVLIDRAV
jgi:hypothetical protein